ncbi:MAG: acyltransferase [Myxococcota bacterium]|nr:acyltransferase [Myxococcota bacterium]
MTHDYFVHPSSVVDDGVEIGSGTKIWYFCHVQSGSSLGERCILGQNVNVDRDVHIGSGVKIQNNVSVYKGVTVEDDVFLGPSCVFTNVLNPRAHVERKTEFRPTRVGRGATVGANATVICGNDLGDYCMVGAGAVVTADVPAHGLLVGVPARLVGWVCRCGERLDLAGASEAACPACGDRYARRGEDELVRVPAEAE